MIYKKILLGCLFSTQMWLQAAQMPDEPFDEQGDRKVEEYGGTLFKNCLEGHFALEQLPEDLSGLDLKKVNLSGRNFTSTNFEGAELAGAILTGTTCDYEQCYQDNLKNNQCKGSKWYLDNIARDLRNIAYVYPRLLEDEHKAALLRIASGLAYLPYYKRTEFYIKAQYWSCKLLIVKKQMGKKGAHLVCTLSNLLIHEAEKYCWQTDYPFHLEELKGMQVASQWCMLTTQRQLPRALSSVVQYYLTEPPQTVHTNFDQYLRCFQEGLVKYNVKSKEAWGYDFYKKTIEKNILGIKKVYPKLPSQALKKRATHIACLLSQKYKIQHFDFLFNFFVGQNKLVQLKILTGVAAQNDIYYDNHRPLRVLQ